MLENWIGKRVRINYYDIYQHDLNTDADSYGRVSMEGKLIETGINQIMIQYTAHTKASKFAEIEQTDCYKIINWRYIYSIDVL